MRIFLIFLVLLCACAFSFASGDSLHVMPHYQLDEITVLRSYPFQNEKDKERYEQLEKDLRKVYPLIKIVSTEYERINKELSLYDEEREKDFLKWYENYAKENYMSNLQELNPRQGRLFLKLITRETEATPYDLLLEYRNRFRAVFWQITAHLFLTNLKAEYNAEENPMIEHILQRIEAEHNT